MLWFPWTAGQAASPEWLGQPMDWLIVADFDMVSSLADRVISCASVYMHTCTPARSMALYGRSRPGDLTSSPADSAIDGCRTSAGPVGKDQNYQVQSGVSRRHHLLAHGPGIPLPGGLANVQHPGGRLLRRCHEGGTESRPAGGLQHRPELASVKAGAANSPAWNSPMCCRNTGSRSAWTGRAGTPTTSSWSGCGGR